MTRNFVSMTDQLKTDPIASKRRTILPAMVACSNEKTKPPAAINNAINQVTCGTISGFQRKRYSLAVIFFGNVRRNFATMTYARPIAIRKNEKNCPRVKPAMRLESGSRKFSIAIRKIA